MPYVRLS